MLVVGILIAVFATVGAVQSGTPGYVVAEVGQNVFISLNTSGLSSSFYEVEYGPQLLLFDQDLSVFKNQYSARIRNVSQHGDVVSFQLVNVTLQDARRVECIEVHTKAVISTNMVVVIQQPEIEEISTSPAVVGNDTTLTCKARSRTQPANHSLVMSYWWQKNGKALPADGHVTSATLTVRNVNWEHKDDTYRCQAREGQGYNSSWSEEVTLDLQYSDDPIVVTFDTQDETLTAEENQNLTVMCSADCNPQCDVDLELEGKTTSGISGTGRAQMLVKTVRREINRSIICNASNVLGTKSITKQINVTYKPKILNVSGNGYPDTVEVKSGNRITFLTVMESNPAPRLTLVADKEGQIYRDEHLTPMNNNVYNFAMTLKNVTPLQHGRFHVIASNYLGDSKWEFEIKVKTPAILFPGETSLVSVSTQPELWDFRVWAYPRPVLKGITLFRPSGDSVRVYSLPKYTELRENLHKYTMVFKGSGYAGRYMFEFTNDAGRGYVTIQVDEAVQDLGWPMLLMLILLGCAVAAVIFLGASCMFIAHKRKKEIKEDRYQQLYQCRRPEEGHYSVITEVNQSEEEIISHGIYITPISKSKPAEDTDSNDSDPPYAKIDSQKPVKSALYSKETSL